MSTLLEIITEALSRGECALDITDSQGNATHVRLGECIPSAQSDHIIDFTVR